LNRPVRAPVARDSQLLNRAAVSRRYSAWLAGASLALGGFVLGRFTTPSSSADGAAPSRVIGHTQQLAAPTTITAGAAVATADNEIVPPGAWEARWRDVAGGPANAVRDAALAVLLENLATHDAPQALALAAAESNYLRREQLRAAALQGWAARAPDSAAHWVTANLPEAERHAAIAAVIAGSAASPDLARQFVERLTFADPAHAYEHGHALIRALAARGEFGTAAQFASSDKIEASARAEWINLAFSTWAQHQPISAAEAALAAADPRVRGAAFSGVIAGWAPAEPETLAAFSLQMASGPERAAALGESLRHWVMKNPVAASSWINQLESSAEIDAGTAAVATLGPLIRSRPDVAVGWAESIVEPTLRKQTLEAVLRTWLQSDPVAARQYLDARPGSVDRMALLDHGTPDAR
jgi:hypothetical protein